VHTGFANFDLYRSLSSFAFLRHLQCGISFCFLVPTFDSDYSSIAPLILRRCSRNV
jgi:hypothetical protein